MAGLEEDTIGGFNSMIAKQKKEAGEALVSTIFSNDSVVIHYWLPLSEVPPMTEKDKFHPLAAQRCSTRWAGPSIGRQYPQVRPSGRCAGKDAVHHHH